MKLTEIAKQQYLVAEGEITHAVNSLLHLAETDSEIRSQLLYAGAVQVINQAHAVYRSEVIVAKAMGEDVDSNEEVISLYQKQENDRLAGGKAASDRAKTIGMIVQRSLMNLTFKVHGKTFMLKDATKDLLEETSTWYIGYGNNMVRRGRWLESIANGLEADETVEQKYSEEKLQELLDMNR